MNNSSQKFTQSQGMKKTGQIGMEKGDYMNSANAGNLGNTAKEFGMSSNSAATLKGKLQTLEESISQVAEEMNAHKKEVASLKAEKDSLTDLLRLKNNEVKQTLTQELNKVEEEMKRHFAHQKAENSRLQQQISQLKTEKTVLSNQLQAIQRRIVDLEMQVGNDDLKY